MQEKETEGSLADPQKRPFGRSGRIGRCWMLRHRFLGKAHVSENIGVGLGRPRA
jgi:hypothetical protein